MADLVCDYHASFVYSSSSCFTPLRLDAFTISVMNQPRVVRSNCMSPLLLECLNVAIQFMLKGVRTLRNDISVCTIHTNDMCPGEPLARRYFSFGLKKLVIFDMLVVLTFFSASTPRLLVLFLFVPAAALSPFPGKFIGGIDAASAAADMLAKCASYSAKLEHQHTLYRRDDRAD